MFYPGVQTLKSGQNACFGIFYTKIELFNLIKVFGISWLDRTFIIILPYILYISNCLLVL